MRAFATAVGVFAFVAAALTGCSFSVDTKPTVSKQTLQKDISDRLAKAGAAPASVSCSDDLVGEVGKTTRCDVDLGPTRSIEPLVTVTSVSGSTVNYQMTPAVSQQQLQKSVSALISQAASSQVDSVTCESGLDGKVDAVAFCNVTALGSTLRREVTVTKVDGLAMYYNVLPILLKAQIENSLLDQLQQRTGTRPDSADCSGNLQGKTGTEVDCVVQAGDQPQTYVVTVSAVDGPNINYEFALK
jgi:Domain of unknown function (DUF4333)